MNASDRPRASLSVWLARLTLTMLALAAGMGAYLVLVGVPIWATEYFLKSAETGPYVVEVAAARCHPIHGLILRDVRVYMKGAIGPPVFKAREAALMPDVTAWRPGRPALREVRVADGVVSAGLFATQSPYTTDRPLLDLDFLFVVRNLDVAGVPLTKAVCRVRTSAAGLAMERIDAVIGPGSLDSNLSGWLTYHARSERWEGRLDTEFDPVLLLPLIGRTRMHFLGELIERFDFPKAPPRVTASFRGNAAEGGGGVTVQSRVWMENAGYRGVEVLRADAEVLVDIAPDDTTVTLDPLLVVRPEGVVNTRFSVLPRLNTVRFVGESGIDPRALARMVGVLTNDWTRLIRLEGPSELRLRGTVDWEDPRRTVIDGTVVGQGIGYGCLVTDSFSCGYEYRDATNRFMDFHGRFMDADLVGSMELVTPPEEGSNGWFDARMTLTNANFEGVVLACRPESVQDYRGRLDFSMELEGPLSGEAATEARGLGRIAVREGRVFLLPIFGGLSSFLTRIIPGLDFVLRQGDASADFVFKDGSFHSEDVAFEGGVLSLKGRGSYALDKRLDFHVQVKLLRDSPIIGRVVRAVTWPLSKLFEFRLHGTIDDAHWYPVNFSMDLFERKGSSGGEADDADGDPVDAKNTTLNK